ETPAPDDYLRRFPALSSGLLADAFRAPPISPPPDLLATVPPEPFAPQFRSDRYVVRQFHARGGIGEIWMADDVEIGRPVALKRLRQHREEQKDRFLVEAQITGQLEHPGIVPVHDLGVDETGRPFYVMTFIHGRTLQAALEEHHAGGGASKETPEVRL